MKHDGNRYARRQAEERLPYIQYECTQGLINPDSGYDIQYQYNKAHNLKVVSRRMQQLIIEPGEVFSFWQLARGADHDDPYRPGLGLHDGKIVPVHGGGLCFMSELLYWMVYALAKKRGRRRAAAGYAVARALPAVSFHYAGVSRAGRACAQTHWGLYRLFG